MNCKFKTFGFLDTIKVHNTHTVQLPYKYYFISPSNKTSRKKNQQTDFFNVLPSSVLDLKSVIALSSRAPLALSSRAPPLYTPCIHKREVLLSLIILIYSFRPHDSRHSVLTIHVLTSFRPHNSRHSVLTIRTLHSGPLIKI